MRILLVSEGKHEGHAADEKPQALWALVKRVVPPGTTFDWLDVHDLPRGNTLPGKGRGHFKLALKAMKHALDSGFDALVLVTDADGYKDRSDQFDEAWKPRVSQYREHSASRWKRSTPGSSPTIKRCPRS